MQAAAEAVPGVVRVNIAATSADGELTRLSVVGAHTCYYVNEELIA